MLLMRQEAAIREHMIALVPEYIHPLPAAAPARQTEPALPATAIRNAMHATP